MEYEIQIDIQYSNFEYIQNQSRLNLVFLEDLSKNLPPNQLGYGHMFLRGHTGIRNTVYNRKYTATG